MASVNELNFNQISTVLTSIVEQATGEKVLTPTTTGDFVSVATTALKNGTDPVMSAITQMVTRTMFSIRPLQGESADGNTGSTCQDAPD